MIETPRTTGVNQRMLQAAGIVAAGIALDQLSKSLAVGLLAGGAAHVGPLHLRLVANRGILMGMVAMPVWLIALVTAAVTVSAALALRRTTFRATVGYALLTAGAVGNLLDRLQQRPDFPPKAVVDWLSFGGSTFNIADVLLVTAVVVLLSQDAVATRSAPHEARVSA
jgi:lipoprotein signal peptidase